MFLYAYLYTKQRVEPKVLIELVFIAFQSLDNRLASFAQTSQFKKCLHFNSQIYKMSAHPLKNWPSAMKSVWN